MATDLIQIGERIKGLREAIDLTPEEMSRRLETGSDE